MNSLGRTYNQTHVARTYDGKRRISIYWTWNYPWEVQRDPAAADNRFSTVTEVRAALWPAYETERYDARNFLQGIAGTLELFHISALAFQRAAEEETGHPVAVYQRGVRRWPVAVGMVPRGEVGLIFAGAGLAAGVVAEDLYSALIVVVMLTTWPLPCFSISARAACVMWKKPPTLTAMALA